ncbi:MAG: MopE-related protein [Deltaproteobacteria bacterium]
MSTQIRWLVAVTALVALACGRTDLDVPEDVAYPDISDVPFDGDAVDVPRDVPADGRRCMLNADCEDHVFCNGNELCVGGVCQVAPPVNCDDRVSCTADQCNESTGRCDHRADDLRCTPGQFCDLMRGCTGRPCMTNVECSDGNMCNGEESCRGGVCVIGPSPICDDGVTCTLDSCDPARGCVNRPENALCDDGVFCNGAEVCNLMVGTCQSAPPIRCDDGNLCTADRCDESTRRCLNTLLDGDGDGFPSQRCGGPDCDDTNRSVFPGAPELCADRLDNDCNGLVDCADRACSGTPACGTCTPTGPEADPRSCHDGRDNDCNGVTDCADPGCGFDPTCCTVSMPENTDFACADGRDNDCNGLTDCMDPGCAAVPACRPCVPTGPEACTDGVDNDCNGSIDCADAACAMTPACSAPNDTCTTPIRITVPGRANGSTRGAVNDYMAPCASSNGGDVVFVMNNPVAQTAVIDTIGSNYDTVLYVRQSNCATGTVVGCDDDTGGSLTSLVTLTNLAAGTYYIFIDGWNTAIGDFQLHVSTTVREICTNGRDDDGDGLIDCADVADCGTDPSCTACVPTGPENNNTACGDGRDNDCDRQIDCLDPDCVGTPACGGCVPTGPENNPSACTDMRDNDCDRLLDCADPDCTGVPVCGCMPSGPENSPLSCSDARDNDCDGAVDCLDTGCAALPMCMACVPTGPENNTSACSDGRDNDCDGLRDCSDTDCSGIAPCGCTAVPEVCNDLRDNDCDRLVDCDDPDCRTSPICAVCTPTGPETNDVVCADGRDNDCDRLIDCADPDCLTATPCGGCVPTGLENNSAACGDGRDNDCDRLIDCADSDCRATPACTVCVAENTATLCANGRDDDCDALVDCADPDCAMIPACAVCAPTGPESTDATCADGRDNDCDRAVDCADPGCAATLPCRVTPPNDTCASPILVGVPSTTTGTTAAATNDFTPTTAGFPGCAGGSGPDLVYTFSVSASTPLTVDLTGGYDTVVYLRRDSCTAGTQAACNDDSNMTTNSRVAFVASPGTYYVFVDGYGTGSQGAFTLRISVGLPAEICTNGIDDNANGLIDCADPDCATSPSCVCTPTGTENSNAACSDGVDNDCDSAIDCADSGCAATTVCGACVPTGPESSNGSCSDGVDNDCDAQIDCADPGCAMVPVCMPCTPTGPENTAAVCADGRDNDCDSLIDCADPECASTLACCRPTGPENTAALCRDGRDNDCNGFVDCADPACASTPACCRPTSPENTAATCSDGRDNDCNGQIDCADAGCAAVPACCRLVPEVCTDGRDNNCNGLTDCADPACAGAPTCLMCVPTSPRETGPAACTDGRDNDCDTTIDCSDSDCRPFGASTECCNRADDNANGLIDEFSCACTANADCSAIGVGGRFPSNVCYVSTFHVCGPNCGLIGGDFFCNGVLGGSRCDMATGECR